MEIKIESVSKRYGNHQALQEVSAIVPSGSIFGLLGPNGAGKTSLIRILNQITGPDEGKVFFNNKPISPKDVERIGYLPEERGLYRKMEVGEQSMYFAQLKGLSSNDARKALKMWFEKFEIQEWWHKKVEELSKGMAQKIQFITTVLHQPDLLIFDEPFSGFDPINAELIKNEILELNKKGATIIFSTHRMESVEQLCKHIGLINRSKLVLHGELEDIRNRYRDNIFKIEIKPFTESADFKLPDKSVLLNLEKNEKHWFIRLRLPNSNTTELLTNALEIGNIQRLEEEIPSVNEIFIKTVQESHE